MNALSLSMAASETSKLSSRGLKAMLIYSARSFRGLQARLNHCIERSEPLLTVHNDKPGVVCFLSVPIVRS